MFRSIIKQKAVLILLLLAASGCPRTPKYFTFYAAGDKFSVELPENLRNSVSGSEDLIRNRRGRSITRRRYIAEGKDLTFVVDVAPVPKNMRGRDAVEYHTRGSWDQIQKLGYTLIERNVSTIYGMETTTMRVKRSDGVYTDLAVFEIDGRIFDLQVSARTLKGLNRPEAVNFFKSFKYDEQE